MSEEQLIAHVTIECHWPEVEIIDGDIPSMFITAPQAPLINFYAGVVAGPPGAGAAIHEEAFSNSSEWIVNHNFGRKPAAVSVVNLGGVEILAEIVHISVNQLRVLFVEPFSGSVRVM